MDRWEYLVSKEFQLRQHICRYFFDEVDYVIDVGAYRKTFDGENVIAIDPLKTMENSFHCTLHEWYENNKVDLKNYAVVVMGLHIEGEEKEFDTLIKILNGCKIAMIEYPIDHYPSINQFEKILNLTKLNSIIKIEFLFPEVITPGFKPFLKRTMHILK